MTLAPTAPAEYNAVLNSKLDAGSAGDLITCRPFDASLSLFEAGRLADLTDLEAMANFSSVAKSGWPVSTDDGSATFCVPMASVAIHGFIYNADAFAAPGLEDQDEAEFYAVLDAIAADGATFPWPWAPTTSGKPPPWATTTSARTTGRAKRAGSR